MFLNNNKKNLLYLLICEDWQLSLWPPLPLFAKVPGVLGGWPMSGLLETGCWFRRDLHTNSGPPVNRYRPFSPKGLLKYLIENSETRLTQATHCNEKLFFQVSQELKAFSGGLRWGDGGGGRPPKI